MEALKDRPPTMWRYREVLPGRGEPLSLGEGMTPLGHARRLGASIGLARLYIKDESINPSGSFKARGLSAAMTVARDLGVEHAAMPSAGNAGSALAAYGALAGIGVTLFLPETTPRPFLEEARVHGAAVRRVPGSIADCARELAREGSGKSAARWYDVSTLREPYRLEGKKTMGYELFEQMEGRLPDVILAPTGGGTGLIGLWKAFEEMQQLGWRVGSKPRMVAVQAEGCAPIVRAWEAGETSARAWPDPRTRAHGLRVPSARGDFLILQALRESGGRAIAVPDEEMEEAVLEVGRLEGIHAAPEGGATFAALKRLVRSGWIARDETVVLINTGSGLKYVAPTGEGAEGRPGEAPPSGP